MSVCELQFPIDGGAVPEDHYYILYSALKKDLDIESVSFLPIRGRQSGDLVELDESALTIRCDKDYAGRVVEALADDFLSIGDHIIRLGKPQISDLSPDPVLVCDLALVTSDDEPRGVRESEFHYQIGKRLGAMLGTLDFGCEIGPRRHVHIAGTRCFGHSVKVKGVSEDQSKKLQLQAIGQKTNMGIGQFRSVYG